MKIFQLIFCLIFLCGCGATSTQPQRVTVKIQTSKSDLYVIVSGHGDIDTVTLSANYEYEYKTTKGDLLTAQIYDARYPTNQIPIIKQLVAIDCIWKL